MKFLYLSISIFFLVGAGTSFLVTQAAPVNPLIITLLSSAPGQTIAAGTEKVEMARYAVQGGDVGTTVVVKKIAVSFVGDLQGLTECSLFHGEQKIHKGFLSLQPGSSDVELVPAIAITGDKLLELRLLCSIAEASIGKKYTWGIAEASIGSATIGASIIKPYVAIARRPDGKNGTNGVTFTIVSPDISLDAAEILDISFAHTDATVPAGSLQTVRIQVKNSGSMTWTPKTHRLVPSHNTDARIWQIREQTFTTQVTPGELVTLEISLVAPTQGGTYELGWYIAPADSSHRIFQTPKKVSVQVVEPIPLEEQTFFERVTQSIQAVVTNTFLGGGVREPFGNQETNNVAGGEKGVNESAQSNDQKDDSLEKAKNVEQVIYCEESADAEEYCDE